MNPSPTARNPVSLILLSAAFVGGIAVASLVHLPLALWAWWLIAPAAVLFIWRESSLRRASLLALAFLLGAIRLTLALPQFDEHSLAYLNDRGSLAMIGAVVDPPDVRDRSTNLSVSVQRASAEEGWQEIQGLALVEVPRETEARYGDLIEFSGAPRTPFETQDFSYKDYLARQGVYSLVRADENVRVIARGGGNPFFAMLYTLRDRAYATIKSIFPEPSSSLLAGILLGLDSGIPRDLHDAFAATNTLHIVAISGFNVAIIAGILSKLARRLLPSSLATFVVIAGLVAYTLLVGANASVVRAAIMGSLSILALHYHRQNDALNALGAAALLMCVFNLYTLFDIGFQLSFLATLGLVLYTEPLTNSFERLLQILLRGRAATESVPNMAAHHPLPADPNHRRVKQIVGAFSDSLIVTLAAQITTTPLILFTFHRLSLISPLTNFLILPAQPPVMILGGIATMVGTIAQPLGQVLAWIAWAFLEWTIVVVQATASLPLASIEIGRLDAILIGVSYAILFGASRVNLSGIRGHVTLRPALVLGVAGVAGVLIWNVYATMPDGRTRVIFIDAGGAATLVRTPAGNKVLIDGGGNPSMLLETLGQRMPFWDRQIDLIVLTSADEGYLSGLADVLERYNVSQIVQVAPPAKTSAAWLKWSDQIALKRTPTMLARSGVQLSLDRGVTLEFLHPSGDANELVSVVAQLRVGNSAFFFAESASSEDQSVLLKADAGVHSDVLIAPKKIVPRFFDAVNPQYTIVFAGTSARDKPTPELLSTLSLRVILDTSLRGAVEMIVEGEKFYVKTAR